MSADRNKILDMLKKGLITAEEAESLLEGLEKPVKAVKPEPTSSSASSSSNGQRAPGSEGKASERAESKFNFDEFADKWGKRISAYAKDLEPKLTKFTEKAVETTVAVTDKLSKQIGESLASSTKTTRTTTVTPPPRKEPTVTIPTPPIKPKAPSPTDGTKNFEFNVLNDNNELNFSVQNGDITIQGYNGDKLTVKVTYNAKMPDPFIELVRSDMQYVLKHDARDFQNVSVHAFVPESRFKMYQFNCTNGKISATELQSEGFSVSVQNGEIRLKDIKAKRLMSECVNGTVILNDCEGNGIVISDTNGKIQAEGLDFGEINLSGLNTPISFTTKTLSKHTDYVWVLDTNNADVELSIPNYHDIGCLIKAQSTLGSVNVTLPNLNFISNTGNYAEAKSNSYDSFGKKLKLSMETSNGEINLSI